MTIREQTESLELSMLSAAATLSSAGIERKYFEEPCDVRAAFARDRDRVIHCEGFRRLKHKTQVFIAVRGDHFRTRLTHTLEVSQIARTIARALRLNEDLTEAIALGHDLGHTPFGHAGERVLAKLNGVGFAHAEQSVRVAELLERDGKGLNLTAQVLDGIKNHSSGEALTPEGALVKLCDKVAYVNHDIDDAVGAGALSLLDLPKDCLEILGKTKSTRITTMVKSVVENSIVDTPTGWKITPSDEVFEAHTKLKAFMFGAVYNGASTITELDKVENLLRALFEYFTENHTVLPPLYQRIAESEGVNRAVTDYIAGMSDSYAIDAFEAIFIPTSNI